jgi:cation diffusion facilitator CzcD-associated flavoprotein CzcO
VLLVIGAGPYGVATAARAIERGIETTVVGQPMGFWRQNMPDGMYLRSGPDWHLDAAGIHTFEAFLADRRLPAAEIDPVPISVFLDYADWFQRQKGVVVRPDLVSSVVRTDTGFRVDFEEGRPVTVESVVAAPGISYFQQLPAWAGSVPPETVGHTCEVVRFDDLEGARVLIVGGRQSAYEWAALAGEHGAERVDIVHRHDIPRFARVSWRFTDAYLDCTLATPGWWRKLDPSERERISREFWAAGRLTLEWWLTPRLAGDRFHRWPRNSVAGVEAGPGGAAQVSLASADELTVDRIILATGYKADLTQVPYLAGVLEELRTEDGFPVLDEAFQSSVGGLYFPGFSATRDFGPFFGFTKGCPAAASLIVDDLCR